MAARLRAQVAACVREKRWASALQLLGAGCPDASAMRMAMLACARSVQWGRSLLVLERMQGARIPPTETAFVAAISACESCSRWQQALQLLHHAEMAGGHSSAALVSALAACGRAALWPTALRLLQRAGPRRTRRTRALPDARSSEAGSGERVEAEGHVTL
ncbi:unnamed protein product [Effrenium voratum]|uniref:Pentatricopeptide repeat-containing protein, chloroplastic n=1 Tax=Effrenium voratum TaxID=2562239 RepID=A0AA36I1F3_9DINO|nr:unnamed protein product [Effrenium voratum]